MTHRQCSDFFVASCVDDGGVYHYRLYDDGKTELNRKIGMPSPMYLCLEKDNLYAVLRSPFDESDESGIVSFDTNTWELKQGVISTLGQVACHIAVDERDIYCANYISGSVFRSPSGLVQHQGHGLNPKRQDAPHVHSVVFSKDKKYLLSCDLGLDTVFVYDRNLNLVSKAKVPMGAGARHLVISNNGDFVYCVNEMGGSVTSFSFDNGRLYYCDTLLIIPDDFVGTPSGSAIKLSKDGKRLYVTERASQSIVVLSVMGEQLSVIARVDCHGKEPRDFTLLSNECYAVCTNQFSDSVALFKMDENGILHYLNSIDIPAPLCAVER